ncbi:uncharacterized protein METZ01_LOCUS43575 [marine metagenome]|uniref:Uncharacterized protein n=1 Tax=marine metagenome TaxID=408172 RepID=A0A381RH25_9ZZZZ
MLVSGASTYRSSVGSYEELVLFFWHKGSNARVDSRSLDGGSSAVFGSLCNVVGCYDQRISSAHPARGSFVGE